MSNTRQSDREVDEQEDLGPHAVQIVKADPELGEFVLDEQALASILLSDKIKDKPVSVVSIAGDFRKGKSFMLNFFLRYLNSQKDDGSADDWLQDKNAPLKGFSWRSGSKRDTTGILMWSEPFLIKLKNGKEVGILLMDTQGMFDREHTIKDSATVFALSTMISSIQVYNIMHNLQEDNLQVLQIFTEYGRLALEGIKEAPFQKLMFLIRDWSFPFEYSYGLAGGQQLLDEHLTIDESLPSSLQQVRRSIHSCFKEIECFLMPHPGKKVATNPTFDGRLESIEEEDFIEHLSIFVPLLLSPDNIQIKKIAGHSVTGIQLMEYFKAYMTIFKGDTMPQPMSMFEATVEANNLAALASAKELYLTEMKEVCGGNKPFISPRVLDVKHIAIKDRAIACFNSLLKMGGTEHSEPFIEQLIEQVEDLFIEYKAQNKAKDILQILGSPIIFTVWLIFCLLTSKVFDVLGITLLSGLFFFCGTTTLAMLVAYLVMKHQGTFPEFVMGLDAVAETIRDHIRSVFIKFAQSQIEQQTGLSLNQTLTTNSTSSVNTTGSSSSSTVRTTTSPTKVTQKSSIIKT